MPGLNSGPGAPLLMGEVHRHYHGIQGIDRPMRPIVESML